MAAMAVMVVIASRLWQASSLAAAATATVVATARAHWPRTGSSDGDGKADASEQPNCGRRASDGRGTASKRALAMAGN